MTEQNIPKEVKEVWVWNMVKYVSSNTMERIQDIITKYPEWFPWETKYKAIPPEVHQAYYDEKYPSKIWKEKEGSPEGLWKQLQTKVAPSKSDKPLSLVDAAEQMFKKQKKLEVEKQKQRKKDKKLWDKHYKKYNLEYKG